MHRYEQTVFRRYTLAALGATRAEIAPRGRQDRDKAKPRLRRPSRHVAKWLIDNAEQLGCTPAEGVDPDAFDVPLGLVDRATWAALEPLIEQLRAPRASGPVSPLHKRLDWLCRILKLDLVDADILLLCARVALYRSLHTLGCAVTENHSSRDEINASAIAALTGRPSELVRARLRPASPLRLLGLVEDRNGGDYALSRMVVRLARMATTQEERLRQALLGQMKPATLAWEDFTHLGPARDLAEGLMKTALRRRTKGVNILLYGSPGTGKSEFARTLAVRLNAQASFVGETDDSDGEPKRVERIAAFAVAQALAGRAGRILLVVDEADDIFTGVDHDDPGKRQGSKVFMNRLVEGTDAPTVWITNHPERLGPAVMRRMSLAIRLRAPDRAGRRVMLERMAERRKLHLEVADLDRLSWLDAAPAILDAGLRAAKLTGGGVDVAEQAARSIVGAMQGVQMSVPRAPVAFDPVLSCADINLVSLADRVAGYAGRSLSFCLHGLPGTGKSAYARHLAARLGIDVVERRASDLLSMFVGGTEKAIAAAFEESADRGAMLILDEADTLLRDRAGAMRSWEVSQVNEMLTQMEAAQHPFACTTNLMDGLDPATLRRFLFKVAFRPMDRDQARTAFQHYFDLDPPAALDRLDILTPGDFAVVAKKAAVLGMGSALDLTAMLQAEVSAKPGAMRQSIGFFS